MKIISRSKISLPVTSVNLRHLHNLSYTHLHIFIILICFFIRHLLFSISLFYLIHLFILFIFLICLFIRHLLLGISLFYLFFCLFCFFCACFFFFFFLSCFL